MQQSVTKMVATRRNGVAPGSVWETRMKLDQVKGGVKVFNAEDDGAGGETPSPRRMARIQSPNASTPEKRKRRNWTAAEPDKSPSMLRKTHSEPPSPVAGDNSLELGDAKAVVRSLSTSDCASAEPAAPAGTDEVVAAENPELKVEAPAEEEGFDDNEIDLHVEEEGEEEGALEDEDKKVDQIYETHPEADAPDLEEIGDSTLVIAHQTAVSSSISLNGFTEAAPAEPPEAEEEHDGGVYYRTIPLHHNRMQSLVDLVMWRDISRTAFVFGMGTFLAISSSYTKDINFSVTSAVAYLGLVYLAVIFLFNCVLHRGGAVVVDDEQSNHRWLVGEDEAIWIIRMVLPYVNEILFKLRALFSGDPATTMKLAVFLFAIARCGGSITFGTMTKMAFFGAFTVPKLFSAYSHHIARYGKFWLERFRDAWESCTHKKAVAAGVFALVWNLSSVVARLWALFMLVAALRYYQLQRVETECNSYEPQYSVEVEEKRPPQKHQPEQVQQLRQWRRGGGGGGGGSQPPTEPSKSGKAGPHQSPSATRRRPQGPLESVASRERKKAF